MNVIVSNKYQLMLENLGIDVIKSMNGEFEVDEIVSTFQNFFYQRMILDITAIKDYKDIRNLQKLSISLAMDKVILLLDDTAESTSPAYLSKLISMGIYNFTRNVDGIQYLYNHPNSYRDVAQFHQIDEVAVVPQMAPNQPAQTILVQNIGGGYGGKIIGIKNVTKGSGASTLTYLMYSELAKNYNVVAIEVDKTDFPYFKNPALISTLSGGINQEVNNYRDCDAILIDVNNSMQAEGLCNEIIYLIEPSIIKLNKLTMVTPQALKGLKDKKVILNQSLLSSKDVLDFEYEAKLKVFFNMPPLDDREKRNKSLNEFLVKLGFDRQR